MIVMRRAARAVLLVLVVACSGAPPAPSGTLGGVRPTIVIQQPVNGVVLAAGQAVVVSGTASDTVGIDRIALLVDGASVAGTPPGAVATSLPFSFTWSAVAGAHTLQVIAYRADGTASDPAVVQVTVGGNTSSGLGGSGYLVTIPPLPSVSVPTVPPPQRTRRPRRSRMPSVAPTLPTATATTAAPTAPAATPTDMPTAPPPTIDPNGTAADDSALEPHQLVFAPSNPACPPSGGPPVAAVACITEHISSPGGDSTDQITWVPLANTTYQIFLTACSDVSGGTTFHYLDPTMTYGCGQGFNLSIGASAPAQSTIHVKYDPPLATQTFNQYQLTIYQCAYANCGTQ